MTRPGVPFEFGGKVHQLRFDMRALEMLQTRTATSTRPDGLTLLQFVERMTLLSVKDVVTAVWVGCLSHEPKLSRDDVLGALDPADLPAACEALANALEIAMPEPTRAPKDEPGGKDDAATS